MKTVHLTALILVIIGALNLGIIGFFDIDVIKGIFGGSFAVSHIIFAIIGIAGLWSLWFFKLISDSDHSNKSK